jgi:uncharacterized protein
MSEIDQQFIEYVVKSLVGKPDAVKVDRRVDEKGVLLELTVDPEDLGRVIGKRGATAQSLRTLLRALGTKNDARYNLKIIDNGVGPHARSDDDSRVPARDDSVSNDNDIHTAEPDETPTAVDEPSEAPAEETTSSPEPKEEEHQDEPTELEENTSERLRQTREELADLDDLDV